ncbi:MAG: T9SS type A sorting domain-containing protein, partial [Bacteroidota bacterium]
QQLYDERFAHLVLEPLCDTSCVWPGDANRDGIANHLDLVAIAAGKNAAGNTRNSPLNWSPHPSEDWSLDLANGLNFKHLDCDGDGIVQPRDFEVTKINYGLTSEQYVNFDAYPVGTELYFEPQAKIADNIVAQEDGVYFIKVKMKPIPNLSALAFTIEYDPRFPQPQVITTANQLQNSYYFTSQHPSRDFPFTQTWDVDFAVMRLAQGGNFAGEFLVFLRFGQPSAPLPSTRTLFRFKNVRAVLDDGTEIFIGGEWLTLFFHGYEVEAQAPEPTDIVVFPNPSDGVFYVRMKMEELNGYQLFDLAGRRLAVDAQFREGDFMVDLRRLAAGIYFLEINREGKRHVRKLVVN